MKVTKLTIGKYYQVNGQMRMYLGKYKLGYRFHSNCSDGITLRENGGILTKKINYGTEHNS